MAAPFPFDYRVRAPEPTRFVESLWYARGTVPYAREKIAPTGSTVAIFVFGDPLKITPNDGGGAPLVSDRGLLIGPHDRPVVNEPQGETFAVGIVTTPVGCEALFGLRPAALRGTVTPLLDAWGRAVALRDRMVGRDPDGMLDVIEAALGDVLPEPPGLSRVARAVAALSADPTRPVADIAASLGVSHGHLDRQFTRVVGLTPRSLSRLLRVRRLLETLDVHGDIAWADRAAELGWSDQSHLIRDFKRHTGVTPTAYVAAQRGAYAPGEPGDGAGFVPESDAPTAM